MRRLLAVLVWLAIPALASAQVAHDAEANKSSSFNTVDTVTLSGKTSAGSNRYAVLSSGSSFAADDSSATYGGSAMTLLIHQTGTNTTVDLLGFIAPPTGATDVVITYVSTESGGVGVSTYNGVDQTTPAGTATGTNGSGTPATIDQGSAADELVVDAVANQNSASAPTVGAGQTSIFSTGPAGQFGGQSYEAGAATVTMSWTLAGALPFWAIAAVNVKPVSGGAPAAPKRLLTLGIGSLIPLWPAWWRWRRMRHRSSKESSCDASLP